MNEQERIARLPIDLPSNLREELRRVYRNMLFRGRYAGTVSGILNAVKEGQGDWTAILHQQAVVRKDSLYPRCYWRALAIGVPDVLVVAHTMKVFGSFEPNETETEVFSDIKIAFEFKLQLAGANDKLPLDIRVLSVLKQSANASDADKEPRLDAAFSYNKRLLGG